MKQRSEALDQELQKYRRDPNDLAAEAAEMDRAARRQSRQGVRKVSPTIVKPSLDQSLEKANKKFPDGPPAPRGLKEDD